MSHPVRVFILKKLSHMNSYCHSGDLVDELSVGHSALSLHLKERVIIKFLDMNRQLMSADIVKFNLKYLLLF
jgi:hypothetical protein